MYISEMNSVFGLFMESWILRVSCEVSEAHVNLARDPKYFYDSMHRPKIEFIAYIYIL